MKTRTRRPSAQTVAVMRELAGRPRLWRYGYDLCQESVLKAGTLYPILIRLADRGLLETAWESDAPPGRPPRHMYRLTGEGREYAAERVVAGGRLQSRGGPACGRKSKGRDELFVDIERILFALSPLALTVAMLGVVVWNRIRRDGPAMEAWRWILAAAVARMPEDRRDWGAAMLAELDQVQGSFERWRFALGLRVGRLVSARDDWLVALLDGCVQASGPGVWCSVRRSAASAALLHLISIACNAFMTHDNFSSGELVPTLLGACILGSLACMFSGVPLGIVGLIRREQFRWLSVTGPLSSILIFGYMQIVQHLAMQRGDEGSSGPGFTAHLYRHRRGSRVPCGASHRGRRASPDSR